MIHSLSGGVIADGNIYTFVKVELDGEPRWFICPFPVKEGDRVFASVQLYRRARRSRSQNGKLHGADCALLREARARNYKNFVKVLSVRPQFRLTISVRLNIMPVINSKEFFGGLPTAVGKSDKKSSALGCILQPRFFYNL